MDCGRLVQTWSERLEVERSLLLGQDEVKGQRSHHTHTAVKSPLTLSVAPGTTNRS